VILNNKILGAMRVIVALSCLLSASAQEKPTRDIRHTDVVTSIAFSPDGRTLASSSLDKQIILWNAVTGVPGAALTGQSSYVYAVAFSPDGKILASASADGTIKLWNTASRSESGTLTGRPAGIEAIVFSPDGKLLASVDDFNGTTIWNVATGTIARSLSVIGFVNALAFSPDSKTLATAGSSITLWDVTTGAEMRTILRSTCEGCGFSSVAFSPDGKKLASGAVHYSSYDLMLFTLPSGAETVSLKGHGGVIQTLVFSPDGETIASGSYDKTIKLWSAKTGAIIKTLTGHSSYVQYVAFSPNGKILASASGQYGGSDDSIILWDTSTGANLRTINPPDGVAANRRVPKAVTPDPAIAGVGPGSGDVRQLTYRDPKSPPSATSSTQGSVDYRKIFSGREVTQKARVLSKPEPHYTEKARSNSIIGTVILRAVFAYDGSVTSLRVLQALPFGLTDQALLAARSIKFQPAMKDGHEVSQYIQLEYNFNLY
jgi:TonB family protein